MRALLRLSGRLLLGLALVVGWFVLILGGGLFIAQETGVLRSTVLDTLRQHAGSLGDDLSVKEVRFSWLHPALELEDVALGGNGELALVRRVRVEFAFSREDGLRIARIDARGGHVRIAPALRSGLDGFARGLSPAAPPASGPRPPQPPGPQLTVRDLGVDWETAAWGRVPIGRVDVDLALDPEHGATLDGRLLPYLAPLSRDGASGVITLRGRSSGASSFDVVASAAGVPLSTTSIPKGTTLDALVPWEPRGVLGLDLTASFSLDGSTLPRADAHVEVRDASVHVPGSDATISGGFLAFETHYAPASAEELGSPRAWTGRGRALGAWNETRVDGWAVLGPDAGTASAARAWFACDDLPLEGALPALFGTATAARESWDAFEPRGRAKVRASLDVPSAWDGERPLFDVARVALALDLDGRAGMTYHGWPNLAGGRSDQGFPLPLEHVRGTATYALDPRALRRFRIALVELAADHPSGPIHGNGVVEAHAADAPPTLPGHGYGEIELALDTPKLAVDAVLERALDGLAGPVPPASTWRPFAPKGGDIGVNLRLCRKVDMNWLATDLTVDLRGLGLAWADLPLPVADARGTLRFVSDGKRQSALSVAARAKLETARELALALRVQLDPTASGASHGRALDELEAITADVQRLALVGKDTKELCAHVREIGDALDLAGPRGFVDAHYERTRERAGGPYTTRAEIAPAAGAPVELQLKQFPMRTSDVRGRVLVGVVEDPARGAPASHSTISPIVGRWTNDVQVAFSASFPENVVRVAGAGIDPASPSLRGSIAELLGGAHGAEPDISGIGLAGRMDFQGEIRLPEKPDARAHSRFDLHLRENTFKSGENFALEGLRGRVVLEDEVLTGERLDARLADTPIELTKVAFRTADAGFTFDADLAARDVPINRRHLAPFSDPKTIDALLDELKWRGKLDLRDGHVTLTGRAANDAKLVFRGTVVPKEMSIVLGLPLAVKTAEARIEELVLEGGHMRTRARVRGFSGQVAGRSLEQAELLVTYFEPRLSIEDMTGKFAGGELRPLGTDSDRGGTLFSIDLTEPYPFQLALDLRDVKVEELLQGLFVSNVANKGRLECQLRLVGDEKDLLKMRGSGSVVLRDSYLWSVPVIRSLLETVRLGSTVTFDSMAANIDVKDGKIAMRDIRVASAALQLAGEGTLDFDGTLDYALDVQLTEIKNLAWLLRFVTWVTDNIVSVSIQGDLDRPSIRAHWFGIFGRRGGYRALPLPGYAPLPPRF
ncbi:MAG: AsmA-like C-terminal region-containing protein [Planctomycetota bacterium]